MTELDLDGQADVCAFSGFTNIDIRYLEIILIIVIIITDVIRRCKEESTVEFFKQCPSKRPEDMKQMKTTSSASYNCLGESVLMSAQMSLKTETLEGSLQLATLI